MRVFAGICLLAILLFGQPLFAVSVVLTSGKTITGDLISEDQEVIRIRADDGMVYSLNMKQVDREATIAINKKEEEAPVVEEKKEQTIAARPATLAEAAEQARRSRTGAARVYTEADLLETPALAMISNPSAASVPAVIVNVKLPEKEQDLEEWIQQKEKEFNRLKALCRNAGADPNAKKEYKTDTYIVNGNSVSVSGYWADPEEVQKAQQICRSAMETEAALMHARAKLKSSK